MQKQKTKSKSNPYAVLGLSIDGMNKKPVNFLAIRRKFSPLLKTKMLGDNLLTLHFPFSKSGLRLVITDKINGVYYINVRSSKFPNTDIVITAKTNKELLTKLFYKYEFFL